VAPGCIKGVRSIQALPKVGFKSSTTGLPFLAAGAGGFLAPGA
jgi:hypothetical protein